MCMSKSRRHHGSISVESEVGTGTSFTFTVPTADLAAV